jgi:hypothetical protein
MCFTKQLIDGVRYYALPGSKVYPSVTSVLKVLNKPTLNDWSTRVALKEFKQAMLNKPPHVETKEDEVDWLDQMVE